LCVILYFQYINTNCEQDEEVDTTMELSKA